MQMRVDDFDYDLPENFIAQTAVEPRDSSKLMKMNCESGELEHTTFTHIINELNAGDVLVMNDTRVIPARLHGKKIETGGQVEILLLKKRDDVTWETLVGGRKPVVGTRYSIDNSEITAEIVEELEASERVIQFSQPIDESLIEIGEIPLPPYIQNYADDLERYQTVYNRNAGSAAAPTAGLHFTPDLLLALRNKGIKFAYCTLNIGLGTFQPVKSEYVQDHNIHSEYATLSAENAKIINEAKLAGGRVIAVGTTSARTLETSGVLSEGGDPANAYEPLTACPWRPTIAFSHETNLYIYPGYRWRVMDGIITNFHLPRSSLLMMISAFCGRENLLNAYEIAKQEQYRFYSLGDAMFIR